MTMLESAKTLLEQKTEGADELLQNIIIPGILADADDFMGVRYSRSEAVTEYFDGGVSTLYLGYVNVSGLTLTENGVTVDPSRYELYAESGRLALLRGLFRSGRRNIVASYAGGYKEDDLPAALRSKLLKQIIYEYRRRRDPGLSSVTFPDGNVQKFQIGEWLPDVEAHLERRRRIFL